ncbi:MAG: PTS system mannose/fructose/sorbose family transporter subunit IID [Gemmatimonadales bacterium]
MRRLPLVLRSFLVQASFNYERMSGVGLSFVMDPHLRSHLGPDNYRAAKARANGFFNAHPYMAPLAAGALIKVETEGHADVELRRFKKALIGTLGLFGDRLVWTGVLPLCAAIALILGTNVMPVLAPVVFLVGYNLFHLWLRWWGCAVGLREGIGVGGYVAHSDIKRLLSSVGPLAALLIGFCAPLVADFLMSGWTLSDATGAVMVAFAGTVLFRLFPTRVNSLKFGIAALAVAFAIGLTVG